MKNHNLFLTLALISVLLASCAPKPVTVDTAPAQESTPAAVDSAPAQESTPAAVDSAPAAVPTSRGDQLQATDPATVSLASGKLQLVEIFRFT